MKKGRAAALEGKWGRDLTGIAQAPAAIREGRRTRLAQPEFRKYRKSLKSCQYPKECKHYLIDIF